MSTEAWRMDLRKNLAEVEEEITVDRDDYGRAKVDITYRFGPPEPPLEADCLVGVQDIRQRSLANRA
jgi:hypothetical protein